MQRRSRLTRVLCLDGNPLRRSVDRLEVVVVLALVAAFLICAPLLAVAAGQWAQRAGQAEQRAQQAWHQITAAVLRSAPPASAVYALQLDSVRVPASWPAPDGTLRTGSVNAAAGTQAGELVRIWVDQSGRPTGPPLSASQLATRVTSAAALTPAFLAVALAGLAGLAHLLLQRRKIAAWGSDWAQVEPQWTRRRR